MLIYDKVFCFSYSRMLLGTTIMAEQSRDSGTCVIDLFGCLVTAPSKSRQCQLPSFHCVFGLQK